MNFNSQLQILGRPATTSIEPNPSAPHPRILVVDDARAIHEDFKKILSVQAQSEMEEFETALFGEIIPAHPGKYFTVDSAFQGQEALACVKNAVDQNRRYSMAFVDVRMPPGWDGVETTQRLWEVDPDLQIVICTAYSDYSWDEMIHKIGQSDRLVILKKPFDPVEVLQLAHAMTEKWSLLQQTRQKMDELENLVRQRTQHLEKANQNLEVEIAQRKRREQSLLLQQDVTQLVADTFATAEEVANDVLKVICKRMQWHVGELWTLDRQNNLMRMTSSWHDGTPALNRFYQESRQMTFTCGEGLIGSSWEKGRWIWSGDIINEAFFKRAEMAAAAGLRSGVAFPIRLQGEIIGIINFLSDHLSKPEDELVQLFATMGNLLGQTLERKKLEEQLRHSQKMDSIGYLAGGVAHDFNNILTVILGYSQIVGSRKDLDLETADGLRQITQAAQRAGNLTAQLLAFSRKQVMQLRELDLNKSIANLAKMLRRVIGEDVTLNLEYSSEPALVQADEDMVGQILMNLAVNARDAMPKGGSLEISTKMVSITSHLLPHAEARAGDFVCLSVRDTGCGMSPELLARIFEPFFTTKEVGQGTGLGLSTVYGIVKQHQGWIEVASQPGAGSTFRIFFPRVAAAEKLSRDNKELKPAGGNETILLVEDESAVRFLARRILTHHGYKVLEAESGVRALALWKDHANEIDILLTDIIMPEGVTGRELAQKLRAQRPELKIVFTSGYDPDKVGMEAELGGAVNFLPKPYSPERLMRILRTTLDFESKKEG